MKWEVEAFEQKRRRFLCCLNTFSRCQDNHRRLKAIFFLSNCGLVSSFQQFKQRNLTGIKHENHKMMMKKQNNRKRKKKLKGKKNVCLGIAIYMRRNLQPIDWLRALLWNATGARLGLDPQVFSSSPSFFVFLYIIFPSCIRFGGLVCGAGAQFISRTPIFVFTVFFFFFLIFCF